MHTYKTNKYMYLFTRRRKRICIGVTVLISIIFILYQLIMFNMISNTEHVQKSTLENLVRGTHIQEKRFYTPVNGKFTCFKSGEVIDFSRVNDNYCDCADSTDEPGTNACPDGFFYCTTNSHNKKYPKMIPSSKVNDGICDCCDGSEEYSNNDVLKDFNRNLQIKMNHFLVPCPNVCR